jgi:peptide/nickel transport system permease protein
MTLAGFIARRTGRALLVVFGVTVATFVLGRAFSDPAQIMLPITASPDDLDRLREQLGLNEPLLQQFVTFLGNAVQGDLGISYWQGTPAMELALSRVPATFILAIGSIGMACLLGIPLGLLAGRRPGSLIDRVITAVSGTGIAVPDFWFAILLIIIFSVQLDMLPTSGYGNFNNAILPVAALTLRPMGRLAQITREATRTEFTKPYVQVARAKGLKESTIIRAHVVKNILPIVITMMSFDFLFVFTGWAASVETVFGWPGLGKLAVDATINQDLTLMSAIVVLTGALIAIVNMFVDTANAAIDRRMRD